MGDKLDQLPTIAPQDYIAAVAQHVSSVCVITTECEGQRYGLTATAVSSVTADPPRLMTCINRSGTTHDAIIKAGRFCVNVLSEDQDMIAMVFAGMGGAVDDRFAVGRWTKLKTGAPVLEGASASFDCRMSEVMEQSSHSVIFGDVLAEQHQPGQDTILYGQRRFRQMRKVFAGLGSGDTEYL